MIRFLSMFVTRKVLDQVYKMYVRPHLDYGDVIFHDQVKDSMGILEAIQYKAGLIVSGCWRGTNRVKLYRELGWESLSERRHPGGGTQYNSRLHMMVPHGSVKMKNPSTSGWGYFQK